MTVSLRTWAILCALVAIAVLDSVDGKRLTRRVARGPPPPPAAKGTGGTGGHASAASGAGSGGSSGSQTPVPTTPKVSGGKFSYEKGKGGSGGEDGLLSGKFADDGEWDDKAGNFKNAELAKMLTAAKGGVNKLFADKKSGGDLFTKTGVPDIFETFRKETSSLGSFSKQSAVKSALSAVYWRWKFKQDCDGDIGPQTWEFLNNLYKSNANNKSPDFGGKSNIYCAAAGTKGLCRALARFGLAMTGIRAATWGVGTGNKGPRLVSGGLDKIKPLSGDILSIVSAGTPRTGHVTTVVCPIKGKGETYHAGEAWAVSGNAGPGGTVAVDRLVFDPKSSKFNPFEMEPDPVNKGKQRAKLAWGPSDQKPPAGKVWVYNVQRIGEMWEKSAVPDAGKFKLKNAGKPCTSEFCQEPPFRC